MKIGAVVVTAVLAAAVVLGGVRFSDLENPSGADASGYQLNLFVGSAVNGMQNDWYFAGAQRATTKDGRLRIVPGGGPLQVISQPLSVFSDRCYVASARSLVRGRGSFELAVMDEEAERTFAVARLPASPTLADHDVRFVTRSNRPITLALVGGPQGTLLVNSVALRPATGC